MRRRAPGPAGPGGDPGPPADRSGVRRLAGLVGLGLLFLLHNDLWLWNEPRLVLGLPAGLAYHLAYCAAAAAVMGLLVSSGRRRRGGR